MNKLLTTTLTFIFTISFHYIFAQSGPPGVPIDGGILTIVGAGIGYGIYRKVKYKN